MKTQILHFIDHMLPYDYLLFGGIIVVFILILALAIVFRHKLAIAIILVLIAFGVLTAGSVVGYAMMHHYLFKNNIALKEVKALEFTEALLIKGEINNTSKRVFNECTLTAGVHKVTHNRYLDRVYPYVPFQKSVMSVQEKITPGQAASFKLFIEPFRYTHDYNITVKADCR